MRTISWFSCGAASAVATKIALKKFPDLEIAYCHVVEEHLDNMRFLRDCERWFGKEVTILEDEYYRGSCLNVFETNFFRTLSGSPCTRNLKRRVRLKHQNDGDAIIMGYTVEEQERLDTFIDNNNEIEVIAPLIDENLTKSDVLAIIDRAGIELPEMYKLGYEHNNCVGCVKGGMGYWNKIRKDFPEVFKIYADLERRKGYTILKDKNGPLYLHDLDPSRGRLADEPKIQCGVFCEEAYKTYGG